MPQYEKNHSLTQHPSECTVPPFLLIEDFSIMLFVHTWSFGIEFKLASLMNLFMVFYKCRLQTTLGRSSYFNRSFNSQY